MKDVNLVRYELFKEVYEHKNKIQDLSLLPPCKQSLTNHCNRANIVAARWKLCFEAEVEYHDVTNYGWRKDGNIFWFRSAFPKNLETIIFHVSGEDDDNDEFQILEDDILDHEEME